MSTETEFGNEIFKVLLPEGFVPYIECNISKLEHLLFVKAKSSSCDLYYDSRGSKSEGFKNLVEAYSGILSESNSSTVRYSSTNVSNLVYHQFATTKSEIYHSKYRVIDKSGQIIVQFEGFSIIEDRLDHFMFVSSLGLGESTLRLGKILDSIRVESPKNWKSIKRQKLRSCSE